MAQRLLVEGENDIRVIAQFWMACNVGNVKGYEEKRRFEKEFVIVAGGVDKLKEKLELLLKGDLSDIESIGIIADADQNLSARWQSIKDILSEAGYAGLPRNFPPVGLVIEHEKLPQIGVWIMPDNQNSGYLEHFYQSLIKEDDDLISPVHAAIQGLYSEGLARFPETKRQKAFVYTWLAWQEKAVASMGLAMKENVSLFDLQQPNAQAFLAWSKQVFQFTEE